MMRRNLGLLAALCALAGVLTAPASASAATETFNYTGASQTWTVPYGVSSASFNIYGAAGRQGFSPFLEGRGGQASSPTMNVTPATAMQVNVGGAGGPNVGGWNGGGRALNGGGGATDIRTGGTALSNRMLIAGGGAGAGGCAGSGAQSIGGDGGGLEGRRGSDPQCSGSNFSGWGGTQTAGGASDSYPGTLGQGGGQNAGFFGGGGGGGGYYGGGAGSGSSGGPGGGGSGYGPAGTGFSTGERAGNGIATVTYTQVTKSLSVSASGPGQGYVSSSPAGISCGNDGAHTDCAEDYGDGAPVTLTANPGSGSTFTGWSGACSGTTTCTVTMSQARSVQASFGNGPRTLSVSKPGNGSGSVTSSPAGINCGSICSADYAYGTSVTLTATPAAGSDFTGWNGGGCSGTSTTCTVTMNQARSVEANFVLEKRTLSATKTGSGSGSLTSDPSGLDCGSTCSKDFDFGTSVTITANPAAGSDFVEWGPGACETSGTSPTCTVTMSENRSIEGKFALEKRTLSVTKSGNGSGTVTSEPAGVDCGSTCSAGYDYGTSVTLTASAGPNSDFGGWSGACSGSSTTCTVTMDEARSVGAAFTDIPPQTTITSGPSGTVRSTSASFGFSSSESGSTFRCRRDSEPWASCTSPKAYSSLSQGSHTFEVAATDGARNPDATPAKRTWKVDTVAPRVTSVSPASGATGVSPATNVLATFSEQMRPANINATTVTLLRKGTTTKVSAPVTYNATLRRAVLNPNVNLRPGATYNAAVTTGARDLAGNQLAATKRWSFTVRP